ncbi:MAG: methionine adenosyltransferase [Saprospiraceae bacterium]|nr:methionine adenosyltransferase [Saprospiraceae bacterium]
MSYLFSSESVSEGHPDKIADQISDALLDEFLKWDPDSHVACETLVTTGLVVLSGEVTTEGWVDVHKVVRDTIKEIGYTRADYMFESESCGIISTIHGQSPDIKQGVTREKKENQGAGDQGMMFGYANREMENLMPMPLELSHVLLQELAEIRKNTNLMEYLRPDSKSQVTILYDDDGIPQKIETIVISTQHDDLFPPDKNPGITKDEADRKTQEIIGNDLKKHLFPRVIKVSTLPNNVKEMLNKGDFKLLVNPTGRFVTGGPHGDTGLTGRKIIVDTYGGKGAHGGGAFSGKDPSKVDRSAAYALRHLAKNMVSAGIADEVLLQVAYAIGVAEPVGLYVNTFGTSKVLDQNGGIMKDGKIAEKLRNFYDLRPYSIIKNLELKNPIYKETARYGHFGRDFYEKEIEIYYPKIGINNHNGDSNIEERAINGEIRYFKKIKFFTWEQLNLAEDLKIKFNLK